MSVSLSRNLGANELWWSDVSQIDSLVHYFSLGDLSARNGIADSLKNETSPVSENSRAAPLVRSAVDMSRGRERPLASDQNTSEDHSA
jgi:hypothetical protein